MSNKISLLMLEIIKENLMNHKEKTIEWISDICEGLLCTKCPLCNPKFNCKDMIRDQTRQQALKNVQNVIDNMQP